MWRSCSLVLVVIFPVDCEISLHKNHSHDLHIVITHLLVLVIPATSMYVFCRCPMLFRSPILKYKMYLSRSAKYYVINMKYVMIYARFILCEYYIDDLYFPNFCIIYNCLNKC